MKSSNTHAEALYAKINHEQKHAHAENILKKINSELNTPKVLAAIENNNVLQKSENTDPGIDNNEEEVKHNKHEAMAAHNQRMNTLWDNVKHASNISLNNIQPAKRCCCI